MSDRTYRALLVANSTFPNDPDNLPDLEGPRNDPAILRDALCDHVVGLFASDNVRIVTERTMAEVLQEVEDFLASSSARDTLVLYYSGHGRLDPTGELYFCCRNTRVDRLKSTAVSAFDIGRMIDDCSASTTVILLDSCHSGAFKGGAIGDDLAGAGRFVLSSTRAAELADDADARNRASVFTSALVDGLRSEVEDLDRDGLIKLSDLYDYVHRRFVAVGRQIPQKRFAGTGDVAIAQRPRASGADLPPSLVDPADTAPELDLSESSIDLGTVRAGEELAGEWVAVINRGGGTLAWSASTTAPWVRIEQGTGGLTLWLTPPIGVHRANVVVRDEASGRAKTIRLRVEVKQPVLPVPPAPRPPPVATPPLPPPPGPTVSHHEEQGIGVEERSAGPGSGGPSPNEPREPGGGLGPPTSGARRRRLLRAVGIGVVALALLAAAGAGARALVDDDPSARPPPTGPSGSSEGPSAETTQPGGATGALGASQPDPCRADLCAASPMAMQLTGFTPGGHVGVAVTRPDGVAATEGDSTGFAGSAEATADENGSFPWRWTTSVFQPTGTYKVRFTDTTTGGVADATFEVLPAPIHEPLGVVRALTRAIEEDDWAEAAAIDLRNSELGPGGWADRYGQVQEMTALLATKEAVPEGVRWTLYGAIVSHDQTDPLRTEIGCEAWDVDTAASTVERSSLQTFDGGIGTFASLEQEIIDRCGPAAVGPVTPSSTSPSSSSSSSPTTSGSPPVEVPDVEGKLESDAIAALKSAGLLGQVVSRPNVPPGSPKAGRVISQDPAPGDELDQGDTVTLVVGKAFPPSTTTGPLPTVPAAPPPTAVLR